MEASDRRVGTMVTVREDRVRRKEGCVLREKKGVRRDRDKERTWQRLPGRADRDARGKDEETIERGER